MDFVVDTESSNLRVRSGPGTNHRVVNALPRGHRVDVVASRGAWKRLASGGWVHGDYLRRPSGDGGSDLDARIRTLLLSHPVREIDFFWRGARVSGRGFQELSKLFSREAGEHRVRVIVNPAVVGSSGALYHPGRDKIAVKRRDVCASLLGKAIVVHECTHAQNDLRVNILSLRAEEGTAFLATTWYLLAAGADRRTAMSVLSGLPEGSAGLGAIVRVAADLRERARARPGPVRLEPGDINEVRRGVARRGYPMRYAGSDPYARWAPDDGGPRRGIGGKVYRGP